MGASQTGSRITARGPWDQIRPIFAATKEMYSPGWSRTMVPELFLAQLREGLVRFQFGVGRFRRGGRGSARGAGSGGRGGRRA